MRQELRVKSCKCGCSRVDWIVSTTVVHVRCSCCHEELAVICYEG